MLLGTQLFIKCTLSRQCNRSDCLFPFRLLADNGMALGEGMATSGVTSELPLKRACTHANTAL